MKIYLLRGLPGAGKSTRAKELVKANEMTVRLNRDLYREMLYFLKKSWKGGTLFNSEVEYHIVQLQYQAAEYLLDQGFNVVIDDINYGNRRLYMYQELAERMGADLEIITLETPIADCIARDKTRDQSVGEKVIRDLARNYGIGEDGRVQEKSQQ